MICMMKNNNLVSIILPVYNAELFLDECVNSLLIQTHQNLELIIINDGSTDSSEDIILKYARKDSRIKYLTQSNIGLRRTLNRGLNEASAEFIARMDADDICMPDRIEKQLRHIIEMNADIVGCHYYEVDVLGNRIKEKHVPIINDIIEMSLVCRVPFAHPSVMFRASFLKRNAILYNTNQNIYAEDLELWCRMHKHDAKFSNVDDFLLNYRVVEQSLSRKNRMEIFLEAMDYTNDYYYTNKKMLENIKYDNINKNSMNREEKKIILSYLVRSIILNKEFKKMFSLKGYNPY